MGVSPRAKEPFFGPFFGRHSENKIEKSLHECQIGSDCEVAAWLLPLFCACRQESLNLQVNFEIGVRYSHEKQAWEKFLKQPSETPYHTATSLDVVSC